MPMDLALTLNRECEDYATGKLFIGSCVQAAITWKRHKSLFQSVLQSRSSAIAVASPPPMQSAATPRLTPRARIAFNRLTTNRAPVAPIGWPSAQAPPLTLRDRKS